jgi:hypothetical protein
MNLIKEQLSNTVQEVLDGNFDPLDAYAQLKSLDKYLKECLNVIEPDVQAEAQKYNEKTFKHKDFTFTKTEGRAIYDFKNVDQWTKTKEKLSEIEELAKASARNYQQFKAALVTEDGEVIEPCIIKYSKPSISVR